MAFNDMPQADQSGQAQAPSASTGTSGGAGAGSSLSPEIIKMLQQMVKNNASPKQQINPPPVKPPSMGANIKSSVAGFIPILGGAIQKSIKEQRDAQIADVQYKIAAMNDRYEAAQIASNGDPQKLKQMLDQDPMIKALRADKKFSKGMMKVFGTDLLNPEKQNTVYHEAMKRHVSTTQAFDKMKQAHAAMNNAQQQQQGGQPPQQPQGGAQPPAQPPQGGAQQGGGQSNSAMMAGMPQRTVQPDPKEAQTAALALKEAQPTDNYKFLAGPDGKYTAVDARDPSKVIHVKDSDGKDVSAASKGKNGPMLVDQVPVGVFRDGKPLTPESPEWNAEDAKLLASAKAAYDTSEANKNKRVKLVADSRALAYTQSRYYSVMDADGNAAMVSAQDLRNNPGKYAAANVGQKIRTAQSIFDEIGVTSNFLTESIGKLGGTDRLDAKTRAQLAVVLRDSDPRSAWSAFVQSSAGETLSEPMVNLVTSIVAMDESAMSLRGLAGMGQASDQMRRAIFKMLPGSESPTKSYMLRQMSLFEAERTALYSQVGKVGAAAARHEESKNKKAPAASGDKKSKVVTDPKDLD